MSLFQKVMAKFGYSKVTTEVVMTFGTFQFVDLIKARGKFVSDQPGIEEFDKFINDLSSKFGYTNWIEAYNKINHPSYDLEHGAILDMSSIPCKYNMDTIQLVVPKNAD